MKGSPCVVFLAVCLITQASGQSSLLEMSQSLWMKLVAGGLAKVGKLDPLRVPVVKVDQSENETMYRIILRNVEIAGLNNSTLESIHIARGRLKSNLSELEAGYVSYSDLRDLDAIRYRFHMLVKEPKAQNESFEAVVSATNQEGKFKAEEGSRYQEGGLGRFRMYDPFLARLQTEQMRAESRAAEEEKEKSQQNEQRAGGRQSMYGSFDLQGARVHAASGTSRPIDIAEQPAAIQPVYPQRATISPDPNARNYERTDDFIGCRGNCQGSNQQYPPNIQGFVRGSGAQAEDAQGSASESFETRIRSQDQRTTAEYSSKGQFRQGTANGQTNIRLENRPGYIDIVYADGKNNGSIKRFGNTRIESKEDAKVYGLEELLKDMRQSGKFIVHNFTEGEPLARRNDVIRTAMEARRLQDLIRYASAYQEKQGYFEEGMQLLYHYGGMESGDAKNSQNVKLTRSKRAHRDNDTEEDVMHVILRIRVPMLRVKSNYALTGKVGKEVVRGNGLLNGNFTDLVGDFTLELKKVNDEMIVRAARSKLVAKDQNIDLQGMNEEGPVASILKHGLMAAEAVAAMLADDLATKALSEKTADAMIYRMYKNLPAK